MPWILVRLTCFKKLNVIIYLYFGGLNGRYFIEYFNLNTNKTKYIYMDGILQYIILHT